MKLPQYIWMDGALCPNEQANVHVLCHGLHYGFGVFEGIRAYPTADGAVAVLELDGHLKRLYASAKIATLEIPYEMSVLKKATVEVIQKNDLKNGCYIRPIAFTGTGELGIVAFSNPVQVAVAAWEWGAYLGEEGKRNGIRCTISSHRRGPADTAFHRAKLTGQYVTSIVAKREALQAGFDEAILLDSFGHVCEGSSENIFIVREGVVYTPDSGQAVLGGITRSLVSDILAERGLKVQEKRLTRDMLYSADEVFLTGTAAEVTPVREIDGRSIGRGTVGEMTAQLQKDFEDVVSGQHAAFVSRLTKITF